MAVKFDALNQVYNHYLTQYAPKSNTPLDTHKKSDLRSIYNSIVKMNKESPLYIIDSSEATKAYAVGLKETARQFRNSVIATRSSIDSGDVLEQKKAYSTHPELATARYIGSESGAAPQAPTFRLEVAALASGQIHAGKTLPSDEKIALAPGNYSFDVSIKDLSYEFQFQIGEDDTNLDVQSRLQRLISNASIGLDAEVVSDGNGNSSLKLSSASSGLIPGRETLFEISEENTSKGKGIVDYLALGETTTYPSNALFEINGIERTASSNVFTVEKTYEVTLHAPGKEPGMTTEIGLKNDFDSLSENVHSLADSYNTFLGNAASYDGGHAKSTQLLHEIGYITKHYASDLAAVGLTFQENGSLLVDDDKLQEAAGQDGREQAFAPIKDFANSMLRKSSDISLNPMQYVNKTIVAYKNPGKNFPAPYITSAYSGLLFNNYC